VISVSLIRDTNTIRPLADCQAATRKNSARHGLHCLGLWFSLELEWPNTKRPTTTTGDEKMAKNRRVTMPEAKRKFGSKRAFFRAMGVPHSTGSDWGNRVPDQWQGRAKKVVRGRSNYQHELSGRSLMH